MDEEEEIKLKEIAKKRKRVLLPNLVPSSNNYHVKKPKIFAQKISYNGVDVLSDVEEIYEFDFYGENNEVLLENENESPEMTSTSDDASQISQVKTAINYAQKIPNTINDVTSYQKETGDLDFRVKNNEISPGMKKNQSSSKKECIEIIVHATSLADASPTVHVIMPDTNLQKINSKDGDVVSSRKDVEEHDFHRIEREPLLETNMKLKSGQSENAEITSPLSDDTSQAQQSGIECRSKQVHLEHCVDMMTAMYKMQQQGIFCDFFITLLPSAYNQLTVPISHGVHKLVFAGLLNDIKHSSGCMVRIGGKVNCEGLRRLIQFAYLGRVSDIENMTYKDVDDIRRAAVGLNIKFDEYLNSCRPDCLKASSNAYTYRVSVLNVGFNTCGKDADLEQTQPKKRDENYNTLISHTRQQNECLTKILKDFKPLFGISDDSSIDEETRNAINGIENKMNKSNVLDESVEKCSKSTQCKFGCNGVVIG